MSDIGHWRTSSSIFIFDFIITHDIIEHVLAFLSDIFHEAVLSYPGSTLKGSLRFLLYSFKLHSIFISESLHTIQDLSWKGTIWEIQM